MNTVKAMRQALEALEEAHPKPYNESVITHVEAITALRTAIAEAEKQVPVAMTAELKALLSSVNGDCYLGVQEEEKLVATIRKQYNSPPTAPAQVPVAWRWRCKGYCDWPQWSVSVNLPWPAWQDGKAQRKGVECEPLYTAPPTAQRQPLTDAEHEGLMRGRSTLAYGRAVEAAHHITGGKKWASKQCVRRWRRWSNALK